MKRKFFYRLTMVFLLLIAGHTLVLAQGKVTVTGKVTDAKSGEPMPFVTVGVKNTAQGTTTDFDGKYALSVTKDSTVVFSFVGYVSRQFILSTTEGQKVIDVMLEPTVATLKETVVIGYGTVKKDDATGSVSVVSAKDFNKGAITSPQQLMMGKSAGVVITAADGGPGGGSAIRIRGGSSLNASNDPLIIVDGVPVENRNVAGSSNALSMINPNDIETFTILKDASAAAIYGSRASNGVIIITTKKSKKGSQMKLVYDGKASLATPYKFVDVYSGDELRKIAADYPDLYDETELEDMGAENTDWQDAIFKNAMTQDHNVGVSGSYKNLPYRVSLGYTDENGTLKNSGMDRLTGSLNLSPSLLKDDLKVNVNVKGMNSQHNYSDYGAVGAALQMSPMHPIYEDTAVPYGGYFQWKNHGASLGTANPVAMVDLTDNRADVNRFLGSSQFEYKLPVLNDSTSEFKANLLLSTDYSNGTTHFIRPTTLPGGFNNREHAGDSSTTNDTKTNDLLEFYLFYKKDLKNLNSVIDLTAGYSWQHYHEFGHSFSSARIDTLKHSTNDWDNEYFLVSFFGRMNYSLANKYLITFTLRDDASSRFHKDNRWGLFPSVALGWKLSEEKLIKNIKSISNLKLRLGWGVTGQQDIGGFYPAMATYNFSDPHTMYLLDGQYIQTLRPNTYDPAIKWEETVTQNIGIDFGLFKDRINGSVDLYKRVTNDLLNTVTIPTGSNFSNVLTTNVGSLENKGIELSLDMVALSKQDMSVDVGFNFTYNQNNITKLLLSDDPDYIYMVPNGFNPSIQLVGIGYPAYTFILNEQVYDAAGNPIEGLYVDHSGDGGTLIDNTDSKFVHGNPAANYLMGLSLRYNYKNFSASLSSRTSLGNYVYNGIAAGASLDQLAQIDYWKNAPTLLNETNFVKRQFTSNYFLEDASFLKLDNITVGYLFENFYRDMKANVGFTVQNVFTVTKYKGLDPEVGGGVDNSFYPRPRIYLLGVSITY